MRMGWAKHERRSWSRAACCSAYEMKTTCSLLRIRKSPPPSFPRTAITHSSLTPWPRSDFQDSMTVTWSKEKIASLLSSAFAPHLANTLTSKSADAPTATIDVLITFDRSGVSAHPNHISLYHGARHFIASLIKNRPGWDSPVDLYTLSTVNVVRKYASILDTITSMMIAAFTKRSVGAHPSPLLFMSGAGEIRTAQRAMTHAHVSQMKWFRWGWIGMSRYMAVNDLHLEKIS